MQLLVIILIAIFVQTNIFAYKFVEKFDTCKNLQQVKEKWTNAVIGNGTTKLSNRFPKRGKVLEIKSSTKNGIHLKLKFPPTSKLAVSVRLYLAKDTNKYYFRNGLCVLKSANKYAVANIIKRIAGKNSAIIKHAERFAKTPFTPLSTLPCGKWVTFELTVDCSKDYVQYKISWENYRWKKITILSSKVKTINELQIRSAWLNGPLNHFYLDDIIIKTP